MGVKVTNNGYGTLSAGIASGDTTITLDGGQGARFPTLGAGDYFYGTLVDTSNNIEVVKVTARSTDSMTVVRGQDNTTARAYVIGDRFELRPTAALFNDIVENAELVNDTTPQLGGDLDTNGNDVNFGDNVKAQFGASNDLQIYHDSNNNSYIDEVGTGSLLIRGDEIYLQSSTGENKIIADTNGGVNLFYDNASKLATTSTGVTVTGTNTISPTGTPSGMAGGGLVFSTPIYEEYHYYWTGAASHTITLTCGSYAMSEVIYTAHQTNGGGDQNEYRRGKWANNYTSHIWDEFENSGNLPSMTTSFTVSDNGGNGQNGKLVIQETYTGGSYSKSTLIVRNFYGGFAIAYS